MNPALTFDQHRFHATREPVKAAKLLQRMEAALALNVHRPDETARLTMACEGLRAGLGDKVRCLRCGRALEDDTSKARRYGADCWAIIQREAA